MSRTKQKKRHTKKRSFLKIFIISLFIFSILGIAVIYVYNTLDKLNNINIPTSDFALGIDDNVMEDKDVMNIALFGLDEPNAPNGGRSDTVMIASIDKVHKKIKITSLMRDTYLEIPGYGKSKLNHAYSYGGAELAIKTINKNFNTNIREFATVDLLGLEKIIDTLGGLEIEVNEYEVKYVNMGVRNTNALDETEGSFIKKHGLQTLTGRQAVAYSRIRKTGDGDYERTERQRVVMEKVIHKGLKSGITKYPALLNTTLPFVRTSLTKPDILSLGTFVLTSGIEEVDKYRIPLNKYLLEERINGAAVLVPNTLQDNANALKTFIYDDVKESNDYYDTDDENEENELDY